MLLRQNTYNASAAFIHFAFIVDFFSYRSFVFCLASALVMACRLTGQKSSFLAGRHMSYKRGVNSASMPARWTAMKTTNICIWSQEVLLSSPIDKDQESCGTFSCQNEFRAWLVILCWVLMELLWTGPQSGADFYIFVQLFTLWEQYQKLDSRTGSLRGVGADTGRLWLKYISTFGRSKSF